MDPKTKQLIEDAEALVGSIHGPFAHDCIGSEDFEFLDDLCSAVREQDRRARHAEAERDAFSKRIDELEAQRHEIIQACLGRDVKDALASQVLGLWKSQSKLTEYAAELEAQLREAVELAAEAVPYVSDYFRDKYEMNDRLAKLTSDSPSPR